MTYREKQLIGLIRDSVEPEQALLIAAEIISGFLSQRGSSQVQAPACPQESDGKAL